jgi:hypothetical protein
MTVLHTMIDGALAAAEMLALLFVPPAYAAGTDGVPATLDRPMQLHRLSTAVDVRLLGSLADVRVAQHLRNEGAEAVDLGLALPAVDERVDGLRVIRGASAVELLAAGDCGGEPSSGHARLSTDEAIADALQLPPGAEAVVEIVTAQPLVRDGATYRASLPLHLDADAPRGLLVEQDDSRFLVILPHRRGSAATLVLRPEYGPAETLTLGAIDTDVAVVIPIADAARFDDLAAGVLELEIRSGAATTWSTFVMDRVDRRAAAQADAHE